MIEVEYPPYSVSDNFTLETLNRVLNLSEPKPATNKAFAIDAIAVESYDMVQKEVTALKSLRDLVALKGH
jgi:hypothetical protein